MNIGNKGLNITISKRKHAIWFDRLLKCPTGHLIWVTMKGNDDTGAIDNGKQEERKEDAHIRLMHPN